MTGGAKLRVNPLVSVQHVCFHYGAQVDVAAFRVGYGEWHQFGKAGRSVTGAKLTAREYLILEFAQRGAAAN